MYIAQQDWASRTEDDPKLPVKTPKNEFILGEGLINKAYLEDQGVNANSAILCLAAVGIDLMLPNVSFDLMAEQEINDIKSTLKEERINYLQTITTVADETFERIRSGEYKDILLWARNEFALKIAPKARVLEDSIYKINKKVLKDAGFSFWKEGVPSIGQAFINEGAHKGLKMTGEELFKLVISILGNKYIKRNLPEIAYAGKIAKLLEKS